MTRPVSTGTDSATLLPPAAIIAAIDDSMVAKAHKPRSTAFLLAIMAGAFIALGFIFYTSTQMGASDYAWYGPTKTVGGVAFSVGLALVIFTGADLFTSATMTLVPLVRRRISVSEWGIHWLVVYVGNFVGALAVAAIVFFSATYEQGHGQWGAVVLQLVSGKVTHSWLEAFLLGIMANLCVCLAVFMATGAKSGVHKMLAVVGPIALFVATGFEHSVANMFLIPLGILIAGHGSGEFWASDAVMQAGYGPDITETINVSNFLIDNLIPVTVGNIVGGGVLVGLAYSFIYLRSAEVS